MNFSEAIKVCFRKYADFSGRASRPEFWWFVLFQVVVQIVSYAVGDIANAIALAALLVPGLAVGARRLHDVRKSGWFQLLFVVPFGVLVLIYWFVQPSDGLNQFGNPEVTPYSPTVMPGPGKQ